MHFVKNITIHLDSLHYSRLSFNGSYCSGKHQSTCAEQARSLRSFVCKHRMVQIMTFGNQSLIQ